MAVTTPTDTAVRTSTLPDVVTNFFNTNAPLTLNERYYERVPGKDAHWIYEDSGLPWLKLDIDVPYEEMYAEALPFVEHMVPQKYTELFDEKSGDSTHGQRGWNTICVHGLGAHKFDRCNMYGYAHEDEAPYVWTEVADACPVTREFLQSLPYAKLYRARFTALYPDGFAAPHIGRKKHASYSHKINFALNQPDGFSFTLENHGEMPWHRGDGFLINADENYHSVVNRSQTIRIHLITMGRPDWDRMNDLLGRSYYELDPALNASTRGKDWFAPFS